MFSCIFIFYGCNSNKSDSLMEDKTKIQQQGAKGVIPSGHKSGELAMLIGKYSLTDLDVYYRKVLPQEKRQDYYENVRKMLISSMVNSYGLLEKGNDKFINYYVHELIDLKLMDPNITLKILIRAEKSMDSEEVRNIASKIYDLNQKVIAGLDNPQEYLANMGQKWEEVKIFSERQN